MNSLKDISTNTTIFLFVGKFEKRKGIDVLLKAYLQEFTEADAVLLIMLTSAYHSTSDFDIKVEQIILENNLTAADIQHTIDSEQQETNQSTTTNTTIQLNNTTPDELHTIQPTPYKPPKYQILTGLSNAAMPFLYSYSNVLVIPSHGEGWGRPHIEAMSCGIPVIATNWSGPTQFLTEKNGYPIPVKALIPAEYVYYLIYIY
jgi:glycosyltransferase involved in cell wall biosynthesis